MQPLLQLDRNIFKNHSGFFLTLGIILSVLGLIAISASTATTLVTVVFLGFFLVIAGILVIVDTYTFWWKKWRGFFWYWVLGFLYIGIGVTLIVNPIASSVSITFLLGIFYLIVGFFRTVYSFYLRTPRWGWIFLNGLISILLGILILSAWPASSLFIIGLFIGIDLLFCGLSYIMAAIGSHSSN